MLAAKVCNGYLIAKLRGAIHVDWPYPGGLMKEWSVTCFLKQRGRYMDISEVAADGARAKLAEARMSANVCKYSFQMRVWFNA